MLTGSKDKTVALSTLRGDGGVGLTRERVFSFHSKVVKTVSWRGEDGGHSHVFASGGQDSAVFVKVRLVVLWYYCEIC